MAVTNNFTDTISISYSGNGKTVKSQVSSYTGNKDAGVSDVIPANTTNMQIDIAFPVADIQSLIMASDQNVTVKVNNSTTPTETFTILRTAALVWGVDYNSANPLGTDVTKFYVTNAGATDAKFDFRVLYDAV